MRTKNKSRCRSAIFHCALTRACRRNVHPERSVRDHPRRRRCYVSTVAKLLISEVIAPVLLFTLFLPPLTGFSKIPGIFRKGRLTFGTSVEKLRHDPTSHCCSLQKERGQDEGDRGAGGEGYRRW